MTIESDLVILDYSAATFPAARFANISATAVSSVYDDLKNMAFPDELQALKGWQGQSPGYGSWKFNASEMRTRAKQVAADLPKLMEQFNADFVAVRGTSGTFLVGALVALLDVPVMLLRKPSEQCNSHGYLVEGGRHKYHRGIILDDMVASGATVEGMMFDLPKDSGCQLVAVLAHNEAELKPASMRFLKHVPNVHIPVYGYC